MMEDVNDIIKKRAVNRDYELASNYLDVLEYIQYLIEGVDDSDIIHTIISNMERYWTDKRKEVEE